MKDIVFREYDIRGRVGDEFILESVYDLGRALAYYFIQKMPSIKKVAVGMDGRTHSSAIKTDLVKALQESGLDVVFIGVCPSPVVYFALHTLPVDAGVMITASHNPKEYNGLKICLAKESVWGREIDVLKGYYHQKKHVSSLNAGEYEEHFLVDQYVEYLANNFAHLRSMPLAAVVDCGNGAGGTVLPSMVKALEWRTVELLYEEVDGTYPHHEADPIVIENMRDVEKKLVETDAQVGIGLDGDADRMGAMTKSGYLVPGDQLLAIFAQDMIKKYPNLGVVFDIKSSMGLIEVLELCGAVPHMSPSGHAIIKQIMKEKGALLAGELSCHFIFHDCYYGYDDGIYAMLRLFEIMIKTGKSLDELCVPFPKKISSPELRIACPEEKKEVIINAVHSYFLSRNDMTIVTIDGVRVTGNNAWGIVRASNTQPVLSLRFESNTQQSLQDMVRYFYLVINEYIDADALHPYMNKE